jgi:integrase
LDLQETKKDKITKLSQDQIGSLHQSGYNDIITLKKLLGVNMGSYTEIRPNRWRIFFYYKGERFDTARTKDGDTLVTERQCVKTLAYIETLIENKEFDPAVWRKNNPFLFERAVKIWIERKSVSLETLQTRERIANKFLIPFFKGRDIREIRRIHIEEFLTHLKKQSCSDKYCYNIIGELRACFRFHAEDLPKLPTFPTVTFQEKPIQWLTEEQQDKVFEFIPEEDKPIFIFQRYTGCRPGEARGLTRESIYWDKGVVVISTVLDSFGVLRERTKTKRVKPLPIVPEIRDCLKPREVSKFVFTKKGLPYVKRTHEKIWHTANMKAHEKYGVPIISMYPGTKHSFGMQRLNDGTANKDQLQAIFGHTNKKSTERYAKYLTESLSSAMSGKVVSLPHLTNVSQRGVSDGKD